MHILVVAPQEYVNSYSTPTTALLPQVILPKGYVALDEWDARRRAEQTNPSAVYANLFRQTADVACYQKYIDSAGLRATGGGEATGLPRQWWAQAGSEVAANRYH